MLFVLDVEVHRRANCGICLSLMCEFVCVMIQLTVIVIKDLQDTLKAIP